MHGTALGVYHPLGFHGLMPKPLAAATSTGCYTTPQLPNQRRRRFPHPSARRKGVDAALT